MKDTREHILNTSLLLFLQKSYRDVTMNELVNKTGLSKGAFYHYFASKEELFKEIATGFFSMGAVKYSSFSKTSLNEFYHQYIDSLNDSFVAINNLVDSPEDKTVKFNFFLILFEVASRFPEFLKMESELHKNDVKEWIKIISVARKRGEIKTKSTDEEIADLFLYCTDGVFLRYVNNDTSKSYKEFLLNSYDTIYKNLKA
ncbi:MAG TPA: TetR/AcrR family transcriptional regulator [Bacteroidales bacterium]|nr:TetR/AcrR family transcriptional regulator [Bacteroidales bacterium]